MLAAHEAPPPPVTPVSTSRLGALLHRRQLAEDLEAEMQFHLAMREQREREAGASPQQARASARRQFGNATRVVETCRGLWTFVWLETWWQDLRYAVRQLRASRGFTAVADPPGNAAILKGCPGKSRACFGWSSRWHTWFTSTI